MIESLAIETLLRNIIEQIVTKADGAALHRGDNQGSAGGVDRRTTEAARLLDFATMLTVPDTLHESLMARPRFGCADEESRAGRRPNWSRILAGTAESGRRLVGTRRARCGRPTG